MSAAAPSAQWWAGRGLAWTLPRVVPAGHGVLFGSDQVDDPDALVILDALAGDSARSLHWTAPRVPALHLLGEGAQSRVSVDEERTAAALWTYARAPLVFHTAGLYTSPEPARGRTVVTVWHGDGPKASHPPQVRGTYMVAGVERFGVRRIAVHGYRRDELLVTGRPRVDDIFHGRRVGTDPSALAALGLDERPIVWWLPTWRQSGDGSALAMDGGVGRCLDVRLLGPDADRFQFVVKPHPLAVDQAWPPGWRVVRQEQLQSAGIRWYRLLGSARAVITDFSSVWADFLATDVPIGFAIGDAESFAAARGFYEPDWTDRLPGPVLHDTDDFAGLVLDGWSADWTARRGELSTLLGANNSEGATMRLLTALEERGVQWRG